MKEFAIWGVPPNKTEEELIYTNHYKTFPTTSKLLKEAEKYVKIFTEQYGVTKARIQVLDLNECPSKLWKSKDLINV